MAKLKNSRQRRSIAALVGPWFVLLILPAHAWASNFQLEAEYQSEITQNLQLGEAVTLDAGGQPFLALYSRESSPFIHGAAIILHDRGGHPDRAGVVSELRSQLIKHGWQTLSLQMPLFRADSAEWEQLKLVPDAQPRLAAALAYLKQQGVVNVVMIGHGLGGKMVLGSLAKSVPEEVQAAALIGLSISALEGDTSLEDLALIELPVLDIYGSQEGHAVLGTAHKRRAVAKKVENSSYRQLEIEGADHQFRGLLPTLVSRVHAWLAKVTPGRLLKGVPQADEVPESTQ